MRKSIHTPEYAALCRELREARSRAGLSQRKLAALLGVPHSVIAKMETAERRVDVIEFCRFIAACEHDPRNAFERVASHLPKPKAPGRGGRR